MGVAALLIIICHAPSRGVVMPEWLATILGNGGIGCDIFLFLSGLGIYNSYSSYKSKGLSLLQWYYKRYIRIVLPVAFFIVPLNIIYGGDSFGGFLLKLSGFSYLFGKLALWYVSCSLFLYLITPLIHRPLTCKIRWVWLVLLVISSLAFAYIDLGKSSLAHNWQFIVQRWPSYFIGYTLAKEIKEGKKGNIMLFVIMPLIAYSIFFILNHKCGTRFSLFWTQGIPVMTICAILIGRLRSYAVHAALSFWGNISLESYATNVLILPNLIFGFILQLDPSLLLFYVIGTFICIFFSVIVNIISKKIVKIIV